MITRSLRFKDLCYQIRMQGQHVVFIYHPVELELSEINDARGAPVRVG